MVWSLKKVACNCRAKGKSGLVALSSKEKMPFLHDPKYLLYKGFQVADAVDPHYELLYLSFSPNAQKPCFRDSVRNLGVDETGFVLYYSHQCPYTAKYVPLIEGAALEKGIAFQAIRFETAWQARNAPVPFTSYSLFYDWKFLNL